MGGKGGGLGNVIATAVDPLDVTGYRAGQAANRARNEQLNGMQNANSAVSGSYEDQKKYLNPYNDLGIKSLAQLTSGNLMQNDPGYQFRLDEGNKAINASLAARGLGNSGAALKSLTKYGQDYASGEYGNAFNRQMQMANMGLNAAGGLSNAAGSYGQQLANNYLGYGQAAAGSQMAKYQGQQNGIGSIVGAAGAALGGAGGFGAMFSDSRLKTNIQEINQKDLEEMDSFLTSYAFNYINDKYGKGDWVGVMAQDLKKSKLGSTLVEENENGELTINQNKVLSMFLAVKGKAA